MSEATIHMRVPAATKARWVRASRAAGMRLTDYITEAVEEQKMDKQALIDLLDSIINEHAELDNDSHRVWLASVARGIRLMKKYGAGRAGLDRPEPGAGFDEWVAGNSLYANAQGKIQDAVGNSAALEIMRRIHAVETSA